MARILAVEDEPLIAMMLADWLVELGHDCLGPACSVTEALTLIEEAKPDAIILDVNLRGERCDRVIEVLLRQTIPFALATGADAGSAMALCASSPNLTKPYDFEALRRVVATLTA